MVTVSMVRAMREYNPLRVPNHPNLATVKKLISGKFLTVFWIHFVM